ncbi:MAG: hypothetical protein HQ592_02820 [Planctomycetes bacterium]|nr:hypothetical protein [Planctomycetota bacterium]
MKSQSILDNAVASAVVFPELGGRVAAYPESSEARNHRDADEAERAQREAEWAAKVDKAFERGLAAGEQRSSERVASFVQALEKAHRDLLGFRAGIEEQAVELALKLAQTVMRTQPAFDASVLRSALDEAVKRAPANSILRVKVNSDDLEAAELLCKALATGAVEVLPDATIGRGGCVLETKLGDIDSTIEQRWEAAEEVLREASFAEESNDQ